MGIGKDGPAAIRPAVVSDVIVSKTISARTSALRLGGSESPHAMAQQTGRLVVGLAVQQAVNGH